MFSQPTVTRPNRSIRFGQPGDPMAMGAAPSNGSSPFSPLSFFSPNSQNAQSPSNSNFLTPRQPVIHLFVCDHANAKVKILTDQFIELLLKSGTKVYTERYLTHQPGYQVRAASLNTAADFFFQIHSKTAGPGHVRLYMCGQPKRMTMEEAVSSVWSWWRLKSGALSKEEVEVLSNEKLLVLLKEFGNVDSNEMNFESIQTQSREAIEVGISVRPFLEKLREIDNTLQNARTMINAARSMSTDWAIEQGVCLQRCVPMPTINGLSQPLKELLIVVIDQAIKKSRCIQEVLERHYISTPPSARHAEEESMREIPIDGEQRIGDGSSWRMMIESMDEDRIGSMQIASYGDGHQSVDRIATPVFRLDDF